MNSYHTYQMPALISEDNSSPDIQRDIYIGRYYNYKNKINQSYSPPLRRRFDSPDSRRFLEMDVMQSPLEAKLQMNMFGKMTQPSLTLDLNSVNYCSNVTTLRIGKPSETTLNKENWKISRQMSTLDITATSNELLWTIYNQLQKNEKLSCTGVQLEQGNQDEHGMKLVSMHIQKILCPNFGTGTEVMKTLSLMNSAELLTYRTYSDGSIDILLTLKSKDQQQSSRQKRSGSHLTSTQENGTQDSTPARRRLF